MDRDGTLIKDKHYISKIKDVEFFEDTKEFIEILKDINAKIIIVSNQSGVARTIILKQEIFLW